MNPTPPKLKQVSYRSFIRFLNEYKGRITSCMLDDAEYYCDQQLPTTHYAGHKGEIEDKTIAKAVDIHSTIKLPKYYILDIT